MNSREDNLQIACASYLRAQYPKALFCHVPNGGHRHKATAGKMKAMGVQRGITDVMVFEPRMNNAGLAIELKIKPNKPTPDQRQVLQALEARGWLCQVVFDLDEFVALVDAYLAADMALIKLLKP